MSYSLVTFTLLIGVALSTTLSDIRLNDENHVYMRLYPNFAQIFRSPIKKSDSRNDTLHNVEQYKFLLKDREFSSIEIDTLTVLFTNVTDRLIVYHQSPNFEKVGTQYIYRRDPTDKDGVEIELVNGEQRLFREVQRPTRYFYLSSYDNLEYISEMPAMPYYEVTFICDNTLSKTKNLPSPLLTYIDNRFYWTPRYNLEINSSDKLYTYSLYGYADIYNHGDQTITIEGLEFVAGDITMNGDVSNYITYTPKYKSLSSKSSDDDEDDDVRTPTMNEEINGAHVYQTSMKSAFTLSPRSMKTSPFSNKNVTVERFHFYANTFEPTDAYGNLLSAFNVTSYESFIPSGPISLYFEGRFLGETKLPDLEVGETYTVLFGYDADISYTRKVKLTERNRNNIAAIYYVEYKFKNSAKMMDTTVNFIESFASLKYFEIKNIYPLNEDFGSSFITVNGTDLNAKFLLSRSDSQFTIRYQVIIYKIRPIIVRRY